MVAAILAGSVLALSACSAEGRIETDGNGVRIGGDVDAEK